MALCPLAGEAGEGLFPWWVAAVELEVEWSTALLDQALTTPPLRRPSLVYPSPPPCVLVSRCSTEVIKSAILAGSASPARRIRNQPREGRGLLHLHTPSRPPRRGTLPGPITSACLGSLPADMTCLPAPLGTALGARGRGDTLLSCTGHISPCQLQSHSPMPAPLQGSPPCLKPAWLKRDPSGGAAQTPNVGRSSSSPAAPHPQLPIHPWFRHYRLPVAPGKALNNSRG